MLCRYCVTCRAASRHCVALCEIRLSPHRALWVNIKLYPKSRDEKKGTKLLSLTERTQHLHTWYSKFEVGWSTWVAKCCCLCVFISVVKNFKKKKRKKKIEVISYCISFDHEMQVNLCLTPAGKNEYQSFPFCVSCSGLSVPYQNVDHHGAQKSLKDTI